MTNFPQPAAWGSGRSYQKEQTTSGQPVLDDFQRKPKFDTDPVFDIWYFRSRPPKNMSIFRKNRP